MRVHYLQHVPFEGLSSMEPFLLTKGHTLTSTQLYKGESLPLIDEIDWLIIMGGPMSIYDAETYSWLEPEKQFIKSAMNSKKIVLGICLGAQLIADALGAKVYKNSHREIGWFNISRSPEASDTVLSKALPEQTEVFHWHGDTFDIPEGASVLAESKACKNQGFILKNRIVALQFHLETTLESATSLIENCKDELDGSQYVQTEKEMLSSSDKFSNINKIMYAVLTELDQKHTKQ